MTGYYWGLLILIGITVGFRLVDVYREWRIRQLSQQLEHQLATLAKEMSHRGFVTDFALLEAQAFRCIRCGHVPHDPMIQQMFMPIGAEMHCLPVLVCASCSARVMEEIHTGCSDEMDRVEARIIKLMEPLGWPPASFVNDLPDALHDELMHVLMNASASGKAVYVNWLANHTRECSACGRPLDEVTDPQVCFLDGELVSNYGYQRTDLVTPVLLCRECRGEGGPSQATAARVAERIRAFDCAYSGDD